MKKLFISCLSLAVVILGCGPKEELCSSWYSRIPGGVVFAGFTAAELDTIWVTAYSPQPPFTNQLRIDTILSTNTVFQHDTAYRGPTAFASLSEGNDYEITLPGANRSYRITDITYPTDSMVYWTSKQGCSSSRTFVMPPFTAKVDGVDANFFRVYASTALLLRK